MNSVNKSTTGLPSGSSGKTHGSAGTIAKVVKRDLAPKNDAAASRQKSNTSNFAPNVRRDAREINDRTLRRITAKVLDDLKMPGVIPSDVIYQALKAAQSAQNS